MPPPKLRGSRAACEEVYNDFRPIIERIAGIFARRYRQDYDETLAEANLLFLKAYHGYDPTKGAIGARIIFVVHKGLLSTLRRKVVRSRVRFVPITRRTPVPTPWQIPVPDGLYSVEARSFVRALAEPDRELVELATEAPDAKKLRRMVVRSFRGRGWSHARLQAVLGEIESAI
jgi:hypothetical protein